MTTTSEFFYFIEVLFAAIIYLVIGERVNGQENSYCATAEGQSTTVVRLALTGQEAIVVSSNSNFRVHYTLSGTDASSLVYAQEVASIAEDAWAFYSNLGWALPPPDGGTGGLNPDNAYDNLLEILIFEETHLAAVRLITNLLIRRRIQMVIQVG